MKSSSFRGMCRLVPVVLIWAVTSLAMAEDSGTSVTESAPHPLEWTIQYATTRVEYIREHVRDYSCRLIKRERIDGELQPHQFADVKVRCERMAEGKVVQPLAVFMDYRAPRSLKGRKVLYVADRNDGQVLVRKGGAALSFLRLSIDPDGAAARRESNHPITEIGFDKIIERLLERIRNDIASDPSAENTKVSLFRNAHVGERTCTHIRVTHPERGEGIEFHQASLYVDDELHVPIRLAVVGWPDREGEKPPLLEEYTYVDLRLNVGLTEDDFREHQLDDVADRSGGTAVTSTP